MRTLDATININVQDNATESGKTISGKLETFFGGAARNVAKTLEQTFNVAGTGIELIIDEATRLEKAFEESFHSINDEFAKLSDSISSDTITLIDGINEFPRKFEDGFANRLKEIRKASIDNFKSISEFGKTTATDLNKSFNDYFFNTFKGHTVSMSSLWASFAESMKSNFLKALADMASAYVTSTIFQAFKGGLNILGFSGGGPIKEDGMFAGLSGEAVLTRDAAGFLGRAETALFRKPFCLGLC